MSQPKPSRSSQLYLVGRSIDENFVYNLEETRDILHDPVRHSLLLRVVRPHDLTRKFHASYVSIWTLQYLLKL